MTDDTTRTDASSYPYTESDEFPVLQAVLLTYFPGPGRDVEDGADVTFLERYIERGEDTAEFAGLSEELRTAIRLPRRSTPMVNEALGTDLPPMEMRALLVDLFDRMTGQARSDSDTSDDAETADADDPASKAKVDPKDELDYYFFRRVTLRAPWFRDHPLPMWSFLVAGFVLLAAGIGLANLPLPSWLRVVPLLFLALGLVVFAASSIAMYGLRSEVLRPEKVARRDKRRAEAREAREERRHLGRRLTEILKP